MVDVSSMTPWQSLGGGALIGLAAGMLMAVNGRVAGISGILGGLLRPSRGDASWRIAFVLGLLAAPMVWGVWSALQQPVVDASPLVLVVAGVLVGLGTRWAGGCTSGHGVCGLSRLSLRSLLATLCFMGTGFATVYAVRHGWPL